MLVPSRRSFVVPYLVDVVSVFSEEVSCDDDVESSSYSSFSDFLLDVVGVGVGVDGGGGGGGGGGRICRCGWRKRGMA